MPGAKKKNAQMFRKGRKKCFGNYGLRMYFETIQTIQGCSNYLLSTHVFEIVSCLYTESRNNIFSTYLKI